jgi:hypothetical protein
VRLFTLGISGPDYDDAPVRHWLAWRDRRNDEAGVRVDAA